MSEQPIELLKLLDLEPIEVNLFRGISPQTKWPRVYGGQVIGQAMVAACRTVDARLPHSLHAYFILAGDPTVPIIYEVARLRDGRSFSPRRGTVMATGRPRRAASDAASMDRSGKSTSQRTSLGM